MPLNERKGFLLLNLIWIGALATGLATGQLWLAALSVLSWAPVFDRSRRPHLPILMFHSINDHYDQFIYSTITVSRKNFRLFMGWLKLRGYRTLSSEETEAFTQGADFGRRVVQLTFDDGYLDNWVNAWPILKRNGQRGTVYVSKDFIRREGAVRPVRERDDQPGLEDWGFLNLAEIKQAHASGVLEFYPHGRTHTWYEHADRLLGFHLPGDQMAWLDWNRSPENKADWIRDFPQGFAPAGWPVFENRKSLEARRFLVDTQLLEAFVAGLAELPQPWTATALAQRWEAFRVLHPVIGRPETDDEYNARLLDELTSTRDLLEQELGLRCAHFCWPGGGKDPHSLELAYGAAGYRMSTIHQDETPNQRGVPSPWLYRIGAGSSLHFENRALNLMRFIGVVETYRRNYCWISLFAITEALERLATWLGRDRRHGDNRAARMGFPLPQDQ
jgi:peptidoglycan/xylan/chitin deacetylase (PgdA/CDA1 family)